MKEKSKKISALIEETKFTNITRNLFLTLAANGRVQEAGHIIRDFSELMQAARGSVHVTVIASEELKKKQQDSIKEALTAFVGKGKPVSFNHSSFSYYSYFL